MNIKHFIPLMLLGVHTSAFASLTTADVLTSSVCPDCLDYQVIGACVWMTCTPVGCDFDTSIKVKHRLPDAVVLSYPETGESPWKGLKWLSPENTFSQGGGKSHTRSVQGLDNPSTTFHNVDVIGHPGAKTVYEMLAGFGFFLQSPTTAFMPYYLSSLDPLGWRYNLPDQFSLESLKPDSLGNFGSVYPRGGFALQPHPLKAAALSAFRAMHVVTRKNQSRLYQPLVGTRRAGYWPPSGVSTSNQETAFQMIYPHTQTDAYLWPQFNDATSITDPYASQRSDKGDYAWAVWRLYKGCERQGAVLVAHFGE